MTARVLQAAAAAFVMLTGIAAQQPDRSIDPDEWPRLELVHEWRWDYPLQRRRARWAQDLNLCFTRDGARVGVTGSGFVEVDTGRFLEQDDFHVVGPAAGDGFLIMATGLHLAAADGRREPLELQHSGDTVTGSPLGRHVVVHGTYYDTDHGPAWVTDLTTHVEHQLPTGLHSLSAIAWNADETRLAVAAAYFCADQRWNTDGIWMLAADGEVQRRIRLHHEGRVEALAFDFDGDSLVYGDRRLRRVAVPSGKLLVDADVKVAWFAPLDPDFAVAYARASHDTDDAVQRGGQLLLLDNRRLRVLRRWFLGPDDDRYSVTPCALSPRRDLIAVSAPTGLRLYRVVRNP